MLLSGLEAIWKERRSPLAIVEKEIADAARFVGLSYLSI